MKTKVSKVGKLFVAICPSCFWTYASPSLPKAHTEATFHTCQIVLGPRPLRAGVQVVGAVSTAAAAKDARPSGYSWYLGRGGQPFEVW